MLMMHREPPILSWLLGGLRLVGGGGGGGGKGVRGRWGVESYLFFFFFFFFFLVVLTPEEQETMRKTCRLGREVLDIAGRMIKVCFIFNVFFFL